MRKKLSPPSACWCPQTPCTGPPGTVFDCHRAMANMGRRYLRAFVSGFFVSVPVTVTLMDRVAYVARVEGASMQPCLNPTQSPSSDVVLLNRWSLRNFEVRRGEVVSLISPRDPGQKMIKRVIALEGDIIRTLSYRNRYVRVPEGHCWVEGDHHGQSLDSNSFGPVSVGLLHARASHVVWPPNRWRRLQRDVPPNRDPIYVSAAGSDDEGDEDDAEAKGKDVKHSRDKRP
ncbi:mitochondrial inner membrane protease subunit 2 isoform X3 [Petromyzon marinus]|uniref:Mitochondrial inner membrane protease subunit 2 n=2 Tax=Petromyzon marinus TaxID=7757 RepID=A0AAJ7T2J8_PETMA|nr:mitochondrial inner membrane protease subunit 2 isoform X2 [Petromyzon marinus]